MKIRGNTIGTPLKPGKNLVKATDLTPEEQAQARQNIGAAAIGEGSNGDCNVKYFHGGDSYNPTPFRSLESGAYMLEGTFQRVGTAINLPYPIFTLVRKKTGESQIMLFYTSGTIRHFTYTDDKNESAGYKEQLAEYKLPDFETSKNRVTSISDKSDDLHYPTAKAVYYYP